MERRRQRAVALGALGDLSEAGEPRRHARIDGHSPDIGESALGRVAGDARRRLLDPQTTGGEPWPAQTLADDLV